jgi:hypothetical protein
MPFNAYKSVSKVVQDFNIVYTEANFVVRQAVQISDYFQAELDLVMQEGAVDISEYAICEKYIYPILKEVWKSYREYLLLWSHPSLVYDQTLSGVPDYVVAKKSPLGRVVFEKPYCVVVEAKQDDFEAGWGQCLAEMVAVQKLNEIPRQRIFGIVSNGKNWEFGQLSEAVFTRNIRTYILSDLAALFGALHYVFQQCQQQLEPAMSGSIS